MKNWTKILPFFVIEWLSSSEWLAKVTVGKYEGTWIYENTFIGDRKITTTILAVKPDIAP